METNISFLEDAAKGSGTYRSCAWIEEGVFLQGKHAKMCCMQNIGNQSPVLFSIDQEESSGYEIVERRRNLRLSNQTDKAPCSGCYELKTQQWQSKDFLRFVAIGGFLHCNLSCTYCVSYRHDPSDRGGQLLRQLQKWLDQGLIKPNITSFDFGGGESTLHSEFSEIAEFAAKNRIFMVVFTNAVGLVPSLKTGIEKGYATVICSVDAGTAGVYKKIKGRDALDRVWSNLKEYAAADPNRVIAKYIVMDSNCSRSELEHFFARAEASGINHFIGSINSFTNTEASGDLPKRFLLASAYILKRGNSIGSAKLADVFSPEMRKEIERLAEINSINELASQLGEQNSRKFLELAFDNTATFVSRAATIIRSRDDFSIMFDKPTSLKDGPEALRMVLGALSQFRIKSRGKQNSQDSLWLNLQGESYSVDFMVDDNVEVEIDIVRGSNPEKILRINVGFISLS